MLEEQLYPLQERVPGCTKGEPSKAVLLSTMLRSTSALGVVLSCKHVLCTSAPIRATWGCAQMQAQRIVGRAAACACIGRCLHLDHALTCQRRCPAPFPTRHCCLGCCCTQCGACRACLWGACVHQLRDSGQRHTSRRNTTSSPSRARLCQQLRQSAKHMLSCMVRWHSVFLRVQALRSGACLRCCMCLCPTIGLLHQRLTSQAACMKRILRPERLLH